MNEELQKAIVDIAKGLQRAGEGAGQFAMDQAPLLAQEFIRWQVVGGLMLGVVCGVLAAWALRCLYRFIWRNEDLDISDKVMPTIFIMPAVLVLAMMCSRGIADATKALVAPRVVLIEKAAELGGFRK